MMDTQLNIKALFYQMQPEAVLNSLRRELSHSFVGRENDEVVSTTKITRAEYLRALRPLQGNRSEDELAQSYLALSRTLKDKPEGGIFSLLDAYAGTTVYLGGNEPEFHQEKALEWREMSLRLGQDLFVCAALARRDLKSQVLSREFCWPAIIRSDSRALQQLLQEGLAENHYHLNGSTQGFAVTWGFLMNHPEEAKRYFSSVKFRDNLHSDVSLGTKDNQLPWTDRIYLAAWLRAMLFSRSCEHIPLEACDRDPVGGEGGGRSLPERMLEFCKEPTRRSIVRQMVGRLRLQTGDRFARLDGKRECLDYAISLASREELGSCTRFLSGERRFLYYGFRQCYSGGFTRWERELFYLYLLLKAKFRNELIQNNDRYGFRNFSEYQDRKNEIWEMWYGYWMEAGRLAAAVVKEGNVKSLEMRIMPWKSVEDRKIKIDLSDQFIQHDPSAERECKRKRLEAAKEDKRFFYVLHFPKSPLEQIKEPKDDRPQLRYKEQRKKVQKLAQNISNGLETSEYLRSRIRGIDAASHEIGCRPEVFAQAFRYLRGDRPRRRVGREDREEGYPRPQSVLWATYHVGEDFLDITDGLRAVDEAVCFLDLRRGERIGHGLTLGIEPGDYYRLKEYTVRMSAQDLLDNLSWLLRRSLQWGVDIPTSLRAELKEKAGQLLGRIYPKELDGINVTLSDHFRSWTLRGDAPECYFGALSKDSGGIEEEERGVNVYRWFALNDHNWDGFDIRDCRADPMAAKLNYYYQYDPHVRWRGQQIEEFHIKKEYVDLIRKMQDCMLQKLMEKGISIECNPSSNYLIGTFRDYAKHPIFRFNNYGLQLPEYPKGHTQLRVSINTDDQGVFDCSLENEYALLLGSLTGRRGENGCEVSEDEALEYLEHIRRMGISVTFPPLLEKPEDPVYNIL